MIADAAEQLAGWTPAHLVGLLIIVAALAVVAFLIDGSTWRLLRRRQRELREREEQQDRQP